MSKHKKPRAPTPPQKTDFLTWGTLAGLVILLAAMAAWPIYWWRHHEKHHVRRVASSPHPVAQARVVMGGKLRFTDVGTQAREFIGYNSSIHLTTEQEAVKREVLEAMPAACCRNSTAYTCCCTCNLSKSVWGLTNYVLTTHHASADQLREVVTAWKEFTNPAGYSGSTCYSGGCSLPFHDNGCGGMSESDLVL
jgi:hypothetical protein